MCASKSDPADDNTEISDNARILRGHNETVKYCQWNPTTDLLASCGHDTPVMIWDLTDSCSTPTPHVVLPDTTNVLVLDWKHDGLQLVIGTKDGVLCIWGKEGGLLRKLRPHQHSIASIKWNDNGTYIISQGFRDIVVWDADTGVCLQTIVGYHYGIAWQTNYTFAASTRHNQIHVFKLDIYSPIHRFYGSLDYTWNWDMIWNPNGQLLATPHNRTVRIWNKKYVSEYQTSQEHTGYQTIQGHTDFIRTIKWHPRIKLLLASGSDDLTVKLWNTESAECLHTFTVAKNETPMVSLAFSPDGKYLASVAEDESVFVWNTGSKALVHTYKNLGEGVRPRDVSWNHKGDKLAGTADCGYMYVIDLPTLSQQHT